MNHIIIAALSVLGPHVFIITTLFLLISTLILIFLGIRSRTGFNLSIGPFKIKLGGQTPNLTGLISAILIHQEEHLRKMFQIEADILKRQVNYADQKLQEIKYLLSENYVSILERKLSPEEDVRTHKDFKEFQKLLMMMMIELRDNFLTTSFIDNHFDTYTEIEWEKFCKDKSVFLMNFISTFLDSMQNEWFLVTRKEAQAEQKKILDKIEKVFYAIYDNCKIISLNSKKEIEDLKKHSIDEISKICKDVYGVDINDQK